jgi:hypothetical protein
MSTTQGSSKARLKNDTLGDDALTQLYSAYETMNFENFRIFAEGVVMAGGGKQPRKLEIINSMYSSNATKSQVLKKAQDFILAGMGLGV